MESMVVHNRIIINMALESLLVFQMKLYFDIDNGIGASIVVRGSIIGIHQGCNSYLSLAPKTSRFKFI